MNFKKLENEELLNAYEEVKKFEIYLEKEISNCNEASREEKN